MSPSSEEGWILSSELPSVPRQTLRKDEVNAFLDFLFSDVAQKPAEIRLPPRVALDAVAGEVFQVAFAVEMHAVDAQFMPSAEQIVDERALSHAALPRDEDVSIYLFSRQPEGLTAVRLSEKELSVKRGFTATIVSFLTSTPLSCSGYLLLRIVPDNLHAVADWESEVRVVHGTVSRQGPGSACSSSCQRHCLNDTLAKEGGAPGGGRSTLAS